MAAYPGVPFGRTLSFRLNSEQSLASRAAFAILGVSGRRVPASKLALTGKLTTLRGMKFYAAFLVWLLIAAVVGFGLWKFSHGGSVCLLIVPVIAVIVLIGKTGCKVD